MKRRATLLFTALAAVVAASPVTLAVMSQPARAAFAGENGQIAFVGTRDGNEEIYVMSADGTRQSRLTDNPSIDSLPALSPDGKKVAFTTRRHSTPLQINDEIYVTDVQDRDGAGNGDNLTRITDSLVNEFQPAFSPDGRKMAFTSSQTGDNEIYVMDADGTNQIRLTNNTVLDSLSAFSPDGQKIAFTSLRDGNREIYVMDAEDRDGDGNGDHPIRITNDPRSDNQANFSPDGEKIAFASNRDLGNRDNDFEIYTVSANGTGTPVPLTRNTSVIDDAPAYSPDGKQLAFSSTRDGDREIYVMASDGSGTPTRLTDNTTDDSEPDWGPQPDTRPPSISVTTPTDGATYTLGQFVNAEYSCQDETGGSGLASCVGTVPNGDPIDTSTVGLKTFTVEATDSVGNTAFEARSYSVLFDFAGLYEPVDNPPTTNVVKAGRSIPVKFSLGGDQGLDIFAEGCPRSGTISADPGAQLDNVEETVAAGTSALTYDPDVGQYTYVWKTDKEWAGQTRQLILRLDDGSERIANFEFN